MPQHSGKHALGLRFQAGPRNITRGFDIVRCAPVCRPITRRSPQQERFRIAVNERRHNDATIGTDNRRMSGESEVLNAPRRANFNDRAALDKNGTVLDDM